MRLEQFYYFVKIADLHSFSAASADLFVSQQALSTSIKNLEEDFQTELFIRTPRGVVLSSEGKYFYDHAREILKLYEEVYNHFLRQPTDSDSFNVALNPNVKTFYFSKIISYFLKEYPMVKINYLLTKNEHVVESVLDDKATLGVLPVLRLEKNFHYTFPSEINFIPLSYTHYALLTSVNSPIAEFKSISMATVTKYPVILNTSSDSSLFTQLFKYYSEDTDIIYADSFTLQRQMVEDNLGNMLFLQSDPCPSDKFCKIPITNDIAVCVGFLYSNTKPLTTFQNLYIEKSKNLIAKSINTAHLM